MMCRPFVLNNEDDARDYINEFKYALEERFNIMIGSHMEKISIM
jgi:hypothetical protein